MRRPRDDGEMQRRRLLAATACALCGPASPGARLQRAIASTGERIPAVGMGTWLTFDVGIADPAVLAQRRQVLERFFAAGGGMIDSSPMYGSAELVLGELLRELPGARAAGKLFSATKVWTALDAYGEPQMNRSLQLWRLPRVDLMQVHNLLNWRHHLKTLRAWKEQGRVRYIGVTTSHGNKHDEMQRVLKSEKLDFLQITYNPADTSAEPLMQLAAERGMAVIVNRPFDGGSLLSRLRSRPLPAVAADLGAANWAQLVLKWELAHPAVTCAIPATTQPAHMDENMGALLGPLPDARTRARLGEAFA
jgi:diketogulonate reductase-like aldo/keto reductase